MRSKEQLIEWQLRRWQLEQARRREEQKKSMERAVPREPWITVNRQIGAGGMEVATRLGEALGYQVYDRQILDAVAEHSDFRRATLEALDEHERSWVSLYLDGLLHGHAVDRSDYVRHLMQAVLSIALHGRAIILGRGAAFFLEPSRGLNVRIVAPLDFRVAAVAAREGRTLEEARRVVRETDHEREQFAARNFGRDLSDPAAYDLVLNTATLGVPGAVRLIQAGLQEKMETRGGSAEAQQEKEPPHEARGAA